jgi:transposase-like protein
MPTARNRLYRRHRFPPEVISYAVRLYFPFPLSLRMVEEMLAARGICVTYETVRQWGKKFGKIFADRIRQRAPARGRGKGASVHRTWSLSDYHYRKRQHDILKYAIRCPFFAKYRS